MKTATTANSITLFRAKVLFFALVIVLTVATLLIFG